MPKISWIPILCVLGIVYVIVLFFFTRYQNNQIESLIKERDSIKVKIDSLKQIRESINDKLSDDSELYVKKSDSLTKTVNYEKIIFVRDTSFDAMCRYISNYRP